MATKSVLPKVSSYVKNIGKSLGFTAIDVLKENAEGISEFLESSEDVMKNMYSSVTGFKKNMKSVDKESKAGQIFEALDFGLKSIKDSIKTGDFYAKAKEDSVAERALGLDDDMGMDFSFDDDDEPSSSGSSGSLADSFDKAIGAAANAQTLATKEGTALVIESNKVHTKVMMGEFNKINASIGSLYNAVSTTNQFLTGPMQAHLENSKLYYETTTKLLQEQAAMTKELLEMQRNLYSKKRDEYRESALDKSMKYNGGIDLQGYMDTVKKNMKTMFDGGGLGMLDMDMGGGNPYLVMTAAPLRMVMGGLMSAMLGKDFKNTLKSFDKGLTSMFSQFIAKLNKHNSGIGSGGPMEFIANLFGIKIEKKESINTANYEKGPVPFDGITRKTIIEVIPGYLARIESALTGREERHFDAQSGKWKGIKQIEKEFKREKGYSIASANSSAKYDVDRLINSLEGSSKKAMEESINIMFEKIYNDGGDFRPAFEYDKKGKRQGSGSFRGSDGISRNAWKYYGFKSKKDFDLVLSYMSDKSIREMAYGNMNARQNLSKRYTEIEKLGGPANQLFNGAYDFDGKGGYNGPSGKLKNNGFGVLATSVDKDGKNVFWYLKEILGKINGRNKDNTNKGGNSTNTTTSGIVLPSYHNNSRESESDSSDGDSALTDEDWENFRKKKEEGEKGKNKKQLGDWINEKIGNTKVGKFLADSTNFAAKMLSKPMEYATKLLNKADESMFKFIFGSNDFKDDEGNSIDSVFGYMIYKVKSEFKKMSDWMKKQIFDPLKEKFLRPLWDKYGKPVTDELKGYGKRLWGRAKEGVNNTFGVVGRKIKDSFARNTTKGLARRLNNGEVISVDTLKNAGVATEDIEDMLHNMIDEDTIVPGAYARGGKVKKRGLTMVSPGEIIIPASFDKKKQDRQLALEKKDRKKFLQSLAGNSVPKLDIGLNARGTVNFDLEESKSILSKIIEESKTKLPKGAAGGVLGLGAGILTGINPVIGAIAGAGLSFLTESETAKKFLFGEEQDGVRDGSGVIPKKAVDFINKYGKGMADFGIAGGLLGLISPFGVLGGAALGAGVGFLKNNEGFKKFIFGDEEGTGGLLSKKTTDKVAKYIKGHVPAAVVGAGVGILTGPFGLLGNAVLGSGLGLLTTTDAFKNFLLGRESNLTDEDGNPIRSGGFMGAVQNGIINPVKEHMVGFAEEFKEFGKKHILDPMKRFWEPFKEAIKNTILSIGNRITDFINDRFEKYVGLPIQDFIQEKIFKPLTNFTMGLAKGALKVAGGIVSAPAHLLGFTGDNLRARQIRNGNAAYMSAEERVQWRKDHQGRMGARGLLGRLNSVLPFDIAGSDKMAAQDEAIAGMNEEQLETIRNAIRTNIKSRAQIGRELGNVNRDAANDISAYMNHNKLWENKKNKTGIAFSKLSKGLKEAERTGDFSKLNKYISKSNLTDKQKEDLSGVISGATEKSIVLRKAIDAYNMDSKDVNAMLKDTFGHNIDMKNKGQMRKLFKNVDAQLAYRKKNKASQLNETPEEHATLDLTQVVKNSSDELNKEVKGITVLLRRIVDPAFNKAMKKQERTKAKQQESQKPEEIGTEKAQQANETVAASGVETVVNSSSNRKKKGFFSNLKDKFSSIHNAAMNGDIDEDSKEYQDAKEAEEEKEKVQREGSDTEKEQTSILHKLHDKLFGDDKKEKKGNSLLKGIGGIFGKLFSGGSKLLSFLGIGGKIALGIGGVTLFGHASEWFKTKVGPWIKDTFIGDESKPGPLYKVYNFLKDKFDSMFNWVTGKDGSGGLVKWITDGFVKGIPNMVAGLGYAINHVVAPLTTAIVKALPGLLWGLGKGILQGLHDAVFPPKDLPSSSSIDLSDGGAIDKIEQFTTSNDSKLLAAMKAENPSVDGIFGTISSGGSSSFSFGGGTKTTSTGKEVEVDMYGRSAAYYKDPNLLGGSDRSNIVDFDENGNPITKYSRTNHQSSALEMVAEATGKSFTNAFIGKSSKNPLVGRALTKLTGKGVGGGALGIVTGGASMVGKGTGTAINTASTLGNKARGLFGLDDKFAQREANKAAKKQARKETLQQIASDKLGIDFGQTAEYDDILKKYVNGEDIIDAAADTGKKKGFIRKGIDKVLDPAKNKAKEVGSNIWNKVKSKAGDAMAIAAGSADDVAQATAGKGTKMMGKVLNAGAAAADGVKGLLSKISGGLKKFFEWFASSKIGSYICKNVQKFCGTELTEKILKNTLLKLADKITEKLGQKLVGKAAASALKSISKALVGFSPAAIVTIVMDFEHGFNNADTILGVAKGDEYKVNFMQQLMCGLLNVVNSYLTLGLLPLDVLMDIFIDLIFPIFGIDTKSLTEARKRSEAILDEWNKAHPDDTYDNLEDFNNKDKWTTKAWKGIKGFFGFDDKKKNNDKKSEEKSQNSVADGLTEAMKAATSVNNKTTNPVTDKYWKKLNDNSLTPAEKASIQVGLAMEAPLNMMGSMLTDIESSNDKMLNGIKDNAKENQKIINDAKNGKISVTSSAYWEVPDDGGNIINKMANSLAIGERMMYASTISSEAMINEVSTKMKEAAKNATKSVSTGLSAAANLGQIALNAARNTGSGRNRIGFGGHLYQNDPSIAGMKYGDSTIGNAGCGPVAAANLTGMSVNSAARYAEKKGMTAPGGGTSIDYFKSIAKDSGMDATQTSSKSAVMKAIKNGDQAVMLGNDPKDPNGAFGTTPHFVTAKGMTSKGNIAVEDPDLPNPVNTYNANKTMNSMTSAVIVKNKKNSKKKKKLTKAGLNMNKYGMTSGKAPNVPMKKIGGKRSLYGRAHVANPDSGTLGSTSTRSSSGSGKNLGPNAILNVARSQIGVHDDSNNKVKYNDVYYNSPGICGPEYPWCCAFVWWCFNQAGASNLFYEGNKCNGCTSLYNWYRSNYPEQVVSNPQPGDMIFFCWCGAGDCDHIGIVEEVRSDGTVVTIEGNTNTGNEDNGGNVMRRERRSNITGYVRPRYPYDYDDSTVVNMSQYGDGTDYKSVAIKGGGMTGTTTFEDGSAATAETSEESGLTGALKKLGTSIVKKIYGEDAYNALFGSTATENASSSATAGTTASSAELNMDDETRKKKIWDKLISLGYKKTSAAAVMGNFEQENGNDPNTLECDYLYHGQLSGIPDTITATANNQNLDRYTTDFVFPAYDGSGISLNKDFYHVNGHYYPGFGLLGWTGPNAERLLNWAKSNGKDWRTLDAQLEFFSTDGNTANAAADLNQYSNVRDAAYRFAEKYEGNLSDGHTGDRQNYAEQYYKKFAGGRRNANLTGFGRVQSDPNIINRQDFRPTREYTGIAEEALKSQTRSINKFTSDKRKIREGTASSPPGYVDFGSFLSTIVDILYSIADNTAILDRILQILSDNFDIQIDKSDISAASDKNRAKSKAALQELINRSTNNTHNLSSILNNKDTGYILNTMTAIAKE